MEVNMLIAFTLTMPNVGSWNGKWTGESDLHAKVYNYTKLHGTSKAAKDKAESILAEKDFYYNFGDGWGANVEVKEVSASQAAKIRRKSKGFCGYDWMIDSILQYGEILNSRQRKEMEGGQDDNNKQTGIAPTTCVNGRA